jgi:hypothetical protein
MEQYVASIKWYVASMEQYVASIILKNAMVS